MSVKVFNIFAVLAVISVGLVACENKGPVEQAAEEVDEAVDTIKNGGQESTASKLDDAADDLRDGAKDAKEDLKGN